MAEKNSTEILQELLDKVYWDAGLIPSHINNTVNLNIETERRKYKRISHTAIFDASQSPINFDVHRPDDLDADVHKINGPLAYYYAETCNGDAFFAEISLEKMIDEFIDYRVSNDDGKIAELDQAEALIDALEQGAKKIRSRMP